MSILFVVVMGIVEGLTEFLPVSSTGHLILVSHLFGETDSRTKTFEIFIQLGAILAVAWEYRRHLVELLGHARTNPRARNFLAKLLVAFLPAAVVGLLGGKAIKEHLFNPKSVAIALIVGGVVMILVEQFLPRRETGDIEDVTWAQAFGIGLLQTLALWPGVSRAAATIIGGMVVGLDRGRATVFSFYLALPTLGAATLYDLVKSRNQLTAADVVPFGFGLAVSFVVALLVIRAMLLYVKHYSFQPMAVYRIILGFVVLKLMVP